MRTPTEVACRSSRKPKPSPPSSTSREAAARRHPSPYRLAHIETHRPQHVPTADATRLALLTWLETVATAHAEKVRKLLALESSPNERGWTDWNRALVDAAEADTKRLPVIAATLAKRLAAASQQPAD